MLAEVYRRFGRMSISRWSKAARGVTSFSNSNPRQMIDVRATRLSAAWSNQRFQIFFTFSALGSIP